MNTTLTLLNDDAHSTFHAWCEGMLENARDDGEPGDKLTALVEATASKLGAEYPLTFRIPAELVQTAQTVMENIEYDDDLVSGAIQLTGEGI